MNEAELRARFPNASDAFIWANADDRNAYLRSLQSEPIERTALEPTVEGEETRWYGAAGRFEIVFTVYSQRPCDWDGYDIKALQDFLITAGIIPDDGWKTLSGRVCSCKAATKAEEKTVIEIRSFKTDSFSKPASQTGSPQ